MAKQKIVWLDSQNHEYDSAVEADRADLRRKIEEKLSPICDDADVDLAVAETWGPDWIRPIVEYFNLLLKEAEERSNKYG